MKRFRAFTLVVAVAAVVLVLVPSSRASAQQPDPSFTFSPAEPTVGQVVQFTDTSTGQIDSWDWNFDDGHTSTLQNPTNIFYGAGTYEVDLTIHFPGDNLRFRGEVTVSEEALDARFTFSPEDPVVGQQVAFTDTSTGQIDSWEWEFGDGGIHTARNPAYTYSEAGDYEVQLTVTNSAGSSDERQVVGVSGAEGEPEASFTFSPAEPVVGQVVRFTDTSGGGTAESWEWDFDDGDGSSARNPTHSFSEEGYYEVRLTVTNSAGESDVSEVFNVWSNEDQPEASFTFSPAEPLVGEAVKFTDTSGGGPGESWAWGFGDGDVSIARNPTHSFSEEGSYQVSLRVENSGGHSSVIEEVTVSLNEAMPEASFTFSPAAPVVGQGVRFTDTSGGGPGESWAWAFGDGDVSNARNPTHSFSEEGSYEVKLTATNSTGHSDAVNEVTVAVVEEKPEASFSFSPAEPVAGQAVRFTDKSAGGAPEYWEWRFGDGETSSEQDPQHIYDAPWSYTVELRVANSVGADGTSKIVEVEEDTDINPPEEDLEETYFVPSASHAGGAAGSFWVTDMEVNNAGDDTATYELVWLPRKTDNSSATYSEPYTLDPGEAVRFKDVVLSVFDIDDGYGALGVVADSADLFIFSRTFNDSDDGTFGTAVPGVAESDLIRGNTRKRLLFFTEDADFRSNIAFQNGTGANLRVNWERYLADGTMVESGTIDLHPWGNKQLNGVFMDEAPVEAGYMDVWTDTPDGAFMVFSSVVDNGTGDGTVIQPQW
jgi:PKD repeat protein